MREAITALLGALALVAAAEAMPPDEARRWAEDLDEYARVLEERHIALYHAVSRAEFRSETGALKARLPELSDTQVVVDLMRLTRRVGDGHTAIPLWGRNYRRFPFEVVYLDGQALVTGVPSEYADLLGSRLVSIDGNPTEVLAEELSDIVPFVENPYSERVRVGDYFLILDVLHALAVTKEHGTAELVFDRGGDLVALQVEARARDELNIESRLSFRDIGEHSQVARVSDDAWAAALDRGETVFVYINRYPPAEVLDGFAQEVLEFIGEHKSENLIIDLRDSYGGDFFSGLNFASWLVTADSIDWQSGVYALTSNRTFSAAMSNGAQFRQVLNAVLVGQPTGGRPCGYQDGGSFNLTHSDLLVMYSKRRYCFEDTHSRAVMPNVSVPLRLDDYREGRDRVMEWVRADIEAR